MKSLCVVFKVHTSMREWLSGGVSPCQGEGRGFESRLALLKPPEFNQEVFCLTANSSTVVQKQNSFEEAIKPDRAVLRMIGAGEL